MTIELNRDEMWVLKVWANNAISGGHWGDGDLMISEEASIMEKLGDMEEGVFEFSNVETRVLYFWLENSHPDVDFITGSMAEAALAEKVKKSYRDMVTAYART